MDELGLEVQEKADLAINQFQTRAAGRLDYSPESLSVVEEMLAEASDFYDELPEDTINSITQLMGSYILWTAYMQYNGQFYWSAEQDQPVLVVGEPDSRISIMTFSKVKGRLSGERADNIPFFYKGFAERVKSSQKGDNALYL